MESFQAKKAITTNSNIVENRDQGSPYKRSPDGGVGGGVGEDLMAAHHKKAESMKFKSFERYQSLTGEDQRGLRENSNGIRVINYDRANCSDNSRASERQRSGSGSRERNNECLGTSDTSEDCDKNNRGRSPSDDNKSYLEDGIRAYIKEEKKFLKRHNSKKGLWENSLTARANPTEPLAQNLAK